MAHDNPSIQSMMMGGLSSQFSQHFSLVPNFAGQPASHATTGSVGDWALLF